MWTGHPGQDEYERAIEKTDLSFQTRVTSKLIRFIPLGLLHHELFSIDQLTYWILYRGILGKALEPPLFVDQPGEMP